MYQLKKIDLPTVALYSFLMLFILGLLFILPFGLLFTIIGNSIPELYGPEMGVVSFFSGIFLLILPAIYALFGTLLNVVIVLCYNLLSTKLGGIKFDLNKIGQIEEVKEIN
jgi:hypothetical protein